MPSLDFPSNPTDQQTYTLNGITYQYNASIGAWLTVVVGSQPVTLANNKQVLYSNNGLISGTNGLVYDSSANTLHANTVIVAGSAIPSGNVFNLAYATANAALANTSGTFAGKLTISGNLSIGSSNTVSGRAITLDSPNNYHGIGFSVGGVQIGQIIQESTGNMYIDTGSFSSINTGSMVFRTNQGNERMRIDANGNIGIGTSSPGFRVEVNSGTSSFPARFISTSGNSLIIFNDSGTTGLGPYIGSSGNNQIFGRAGVAEYMRIDASGRVTIPNQPFFMGQPTTDYSGGSMPTRVMDVTALYNNGGHFNNSTDRFTCPVTGWYRSTWGGLQLPVTVTSLMVNGSRAYNGNHYPAASPNYITMTQTALRYLNAGDYLEIEQWNGGGYYNAWWLWTVELVG